MKFVLAIFFIFSIPVHANPVHDNYQPYLTTYKSCMDIFEQESRLDCLENSINGLRALSLHRNGEDGSEASNWLATNKCGVERTVDSLLCRIRIIDFWAH